jgi:hypothetical protein
VAAMQGASNRLIDVESLSERELGVLGEHYRELAKLCQNESDITQSHSLEEAGERHCGKRAGSKSNRYALLRTMTRHHVAAVNYYRVERDRRCLLIILRVMLALN